MRLYLAQHGLAREPSEDPQRPLSDQGREDVSRVAGFLSLFARPQPLVIAHSGKLRAQQTAEMFAEAWGVKDVRVMPDLAPNDDPAVWSAHLAGMDEDVMLVGHLPHLQRLAGLLLCDDVSRTPLTFRQGGVACMERQGGNWSLQWMVVPQLFYA